MACLFFPQVSLARSDGENKNGRKKKTLKSEIDFSSLCSPSQRAGKGSMLQTLASPSGASPRLDRISRLPETCTEIQFRIQKFFGGRKKVEFFLLSS
jgi:hypothetical protein